MKKKELKNNNKNTANKTIVILSTILTIIYGLLTFTFIIVLGKELKIIIEALVLAIIPILLFVYGYKTKNNIVLISIIICEILIAYISWSFLKP